MVLYCPLVALWLILVYFVDPLPSSVSVLTCLLLPQLFVYKLLELLLTQRRQAVQIQIYLLG